MNRARTLLRFSYSARTFAKKFRHFSSQPCEDAQVLSTPKYWKKKDFVTLSCTNRTVEDYMLSYSDGSELNYEISFCPQTYHHMTNSCHGLVGVYASGILWISNPSIAELTSLQRKYDRSEQNMPQSAIGFDASKSEYKVVELYPPRGHEGFGVGPMRCKVLNLTQTGIKWRKIDNCPPSGLQLKEDHLPVTADGFVYWTLEPKYSRSKFKRPAAALCFDLSKEEFSIVLHPEGYSRNGTSRLVDLGGHPYLADTRSGRMTIWSLEDRMNSEWVKKYDIDLSKLEESDFLPSYKLIPLTIDEERIVFYYGQDGRREYYDISTMSFLEHEIVDNVDLEFVAPCANINTWPWTSPNEKVYVKKSYDSDESDKDSDGSDDSDEGSDDSKDSDSNDSKDSDDSKDADSNDSRDSEEKK